MTPTKPDPSTLPTLRFAFLCVNAHKGQAPQRVAVIQNCEKRVRIRALKPTRLGGQGKLLQPGETALVPKWSVHNHAPKPEGLSTKRPKPTAPMKFFLFHIETVAGPRVRYYKAKAEHTARGQADKVQDVVRVGKSHPITEAQYEAGRKAIKQ